MGNYVDERGDTVSSGETEKVVVATPVEARQGFLGRPVLMVLAGGLVLVAVAWAIAGRYGEAIDKDIPNTQQQTTTNAVVTPPDQKAIGTTPLAGAKNADNANRP